MNPSIGTGSGCTVVDIPRAAIEDLVERHVPDLARLKGFAGFDPEYLHLIRRENGRFR